MILDFQGRPLVRAIGFVGGLRRERAPLSDRRLESLVGFDAPPSKDEEDAPAEPEPATPAELTL